MNIKKIFTSQKSYSRWRLTRVKRIEKRFPEIFRVKDKKVLDIGCGAQAILSSYLSNVKNGRLYAGDVDPTAVTSAKKIAKKVRFSVFPAESLPFKDNYFDFVFLLDILEHVTNPLLAIQEAQRVIKKNGIVYVEFSPYYAYPTGHHLYPLGFPLGMLPFQFIPISITKQIVYNTKFNIKNLGHHLFEQFKTLNKISIREYKSIVRKLEIKLLKEAYLIVLPDREINIDFVANIPVLNELLTLSYVSIFTKNHT